MTTNVEKMQPSTLTVGKLVGCFDLCTSVQLDKTFGRGASEGYAFLEQYRKTFKEMTVLRVFICSGRRFTIGDSEALSYLRNHQLVFIPLMEPETARRNLLPSAVTDKLYLRLYSHLLYLLWQHLRTYRGEEDLKAAAVISFQNVPELTECRDTFSRICTPLTDAYNKPLLTPVKQTLLQDLERFELRNQ